MAGTFNVEYINVTGISEKKLFLQKFNLTPSRKHAHTIVENNLDTLLNIIQNLVWSRNRTKRIETPTTAIIDCPL